MLKLDDGELRIILSALNRERSELQSRLEESKEGGIQCLLNNGMPDYEVFVDMICRTTVDIYRHDALITKIEVEAES